MYLLIKVKNTSAWALLSAVVCLVAGFIVYFFFVHWNPALYIVGMILLGLAIASVPVIRCLVKKDNLKKTLITAAIWLAATLAVLFGLALLLNNALVLGEALAILCVLTAAAVTMIVNTVLLVLADVKKKN